MSALKLPRILCVDDVPAVLSSLVVTLRKDFDVQTAPNADEALRMLAEGGYAVVCSDMRMPGISGAELLKLVMQRFPEVTRIMFTGETGRESAANAVNEGHIFRFLTKPCPGDKIKAAIEAGVAHHRTLMAERVLLQETLIGCIKALIDVLAITNPVAFGRASRVKRLAKDFANELGYGGHWQLDAAALLSQIGYLSLPVELVEKLYHGEPLSPDEKVLASGVPAVANKLLGHIPRLEPVLQILAGINAPQSAKPLTGSLGTCAKILALVLDYDSFVAQGMNGAAAIKRLMTDNHHEPEMIQRLELRIRATTGGTEVRRVSLRSVLPGMIIMDELRSEFGVLLVPRGFEVSETFLERMPNLGPKLLAETVRVLVAPPRLPQEG